MENGQLSFLGEVKRPSKVKPNPVVDHIMDNIAGDPTGRDGAPQRQEKKETSGLVTLRVPSNPNDPNGTRPLDINLNGQNYRLPRDTTARVPKEIAEVIINAQASKSVVPAARGERVVCRVDQESNEVSGMTTVENRRFNVIVEDEE